MQIVRLVTGWTAILALAAGLAGCGDDGSSVTIVAAPPGLTITVSPTDPPVPPEPPPPAPTPQSFKITSPVRLAAYDDSTLLVSDYDSGKILFVDKATLEATGGFSIAGKPSGVLFADGRIFVGNTLSRSVEVFDEQGNILSRLGSRGAFVRVNDLDVDRNLGLIYILDADARLIKAFRFDGSEAGTIGAGVLVKPTALSVDPAGNLLVSDFGAKPGSFSGAPTYVRVFNSRGAFSGSFSVGSSVDTLPQGLFADPAGQVFVANSRSGQVKVFNLASKSLLRTMGTLGVGDGEFFLPLDVIVDDVSHDVFVADFSNKRISVVRQGGAATP